MRGCPLWGCTSQLLPVDTGVLSLSLATQPLRMDPPAGHLIGWWDKAKIKKNGILQPSKSWKNLSSFSTQPPPHLLCISRLPAQTKYCCHSDRWSGYWAWWYNTIVTSINNFTGAWRPVFKRFCDNSNMLPKQSEHSHWTLPPQHRCAKQHSGWRLQ